jgi:hypothetical protein
MGTCVQTKFFITALETSKTGWNLCCWGVYVLMVTMTTILIALNTATPRWITKVM